MIPQRPLSSAAPVTFCAPRPGVREPVALPLTTAQRELWFLSRLSDASSRAYNEPAALRIRGPLDARVLRRALRDLVRRHEALRTRFGADGDAQFVEPRVRLCLPLLDLSGTPAAHADAALAQVLREEAAFVFDLCTPPLVRARLVRLAGDHHIFVLTVHHAVTDGWSNGMLHKELWDLYAARRDGEPAGLPAPGSYVDAVLMRATAEKDPEPLEYWRGALAGPPPVLELPTDHPRPAQPSFAGERVRMTLDPAVVQAATALGRAHGATFYHVLLAAFQLLLHRLTGQDDVVAGTPAAGQAWDDEAAVGYFAYLLPIRSRLRGDPSFADFLAQTQARALDAVEYRATPLSRMLEALEIPRDTARAPLAAVSLTWQRGVDGARERAGLQVERMELRTGASRLELAVIAVETAAETRLEVEYDSALFRGETVARWMGHLQSLLAAAAADPDRPVGAISILSADQRKEVLEDWNRAPARSAAGPLLHQPFERMADAAPDAVALEMDGERVTYAELEARANRVAHALRRAGVGADTVVGLCAERSAAMVAGILGILKAGGAWLPLDPALPADRLAVVLHDAAPPVVLAQARARDAVAAAGVPVLGLGLEETALDADLPISRVECGADGRTLAYVIYTSGSTGRPKGVMIPHAGICNRVGWVMETYPAGPADAVLYKTPFTFDASVWELFLPLWTGGRVVIARPDGHRDPDYLIDTVARHGVTYLQLVPSMLQVVAARPGLERCATLRHLACGGEGYPAPLAREVARRLPHATLVNLYGPTEASIDVASWRFDGDDGAGLLPIGRPVAGTRLYVLDARLHPVAPGVAGELYADGPGLARGYLGRPAMTAERFIPDPFSPVPGARMYRTGDRARWKCVSAEVRECGSELHAPLGDPTHALTHSRTHALTNSRTHALEFLGRADDQLKVRGFRIEPGEIEAALAAVPGVREAAVAAREHAPGDLRLAAYVVGDADAQALREHLRGTLPEYMVPGTIVRLDALPRTTSGKLDRRALAKVEIAPEADDAASLADAPAAALTPVEEMVAAIFGDLLKTDGIGAGDDFFARGGHSLLALKLLWRIRDAFAVELSAATLFSHPTVCALAGAVEDARRAGLPSAPPVAAVKRSGPMPLSFAQERLWFLHRMEPESAYYNTPLLLRLRGTLDSTALERALGEIVRRHESLRTTFRDEGGVPAAVVAPAGPFILPIDDLSALDDAAREAQVERHALAESGRVYDLAAGPLFRVRLLRLAADEHVLVAGLHHIVTDGWSLGVFQRELAALYSAFRDGLPSPLPEPAVQYVDHAVWQRAQLRGEFLEQRLAYWRARLAGMPEVLELPTDRPRPPVQRFKGERVPVSFPAALLEGLRAAGRRESVTLFAVVLGAFQCLLSRYAGTDDVVVGSPIAGRTQPEVEGLIGFFVNTVVLRTDLSGDPTLREVLHRARSVALGAYEHQELPFERLVEELRPERSLAHSPLVQVMFSLQGAESVLAQLPGLRMEPLWAEAGNVRFDLSLTLAARDDGLRGDIAYSSDLFDRATVERMAQRLGRVLEQVASSPKMRLSALALLGDAERAQVLEGWQGSARTLPPGTCADLFAAQAARTPDAEAIRFEGRAVTYRALDQAANQLAHHLAARGVGPEARVGIVGERRPETVMCILAVLKSGGAYVPLDPAYPAERLAMMMEDAGVRVVIAPAGLPAGFPQPADVLDLRAEADAIAARPSSAPRVNVDADGLAYVIYTSGSTGRPKGVLVAHRGIPNLALAHIQARRLGPGSRVLQFASFSFDATVSEMFTTLLSGATLVMAPREALLPGAPLLQTLRGERVTAAVLTPSVLALLPPDGLPDLVTVISAGEAVDSVVVERWSAGRRFLNVYGPTEGTVGTCYAVCTADGRTPPIGRPLHNVRAYVLDPAGQPAPVGIPGELYVGGAGVARGYLHRPALTAERFVPDPFGTPGARLYRTGDRVRWVESAGVRECVSAEVTHETTPALTHSRTHALSPALVFLGRVDAQVKIRGFRIEPGEVEAEIRRHDGVRDCAVIAREDSPGDRRLVAYVVGDADASALRRALAERLPDHMVPAAFVALDQMPRTPNGKLDRRALPAPVYAAAAEAQDAPMSPLEEVLAGIWADVLRVGRVGPRDGFFLLGGHSLMATRLVSRVREVLGVELPVRAVFEAPTVEEMAVRVEALRRQAVALLPAVAPVDRTRALPLSFAQERLWFLERVQRDASLYTISLALRLEGALDAGALERALGELVRRHESLRTTFRMIDGALAQVIAPADGFALAAEDLSGLDAVAREAWADRRAREDAARPFDLEAGPLFRATLLRLAETQHVLLIAMHHAVSDGWSMGVLHQELSALYEAFRDGAASPLPEPALQYADYAVWQRDHLAGVLDAQLAYWRTRLAGAPALLELPADRPRPAVQQYHGAREAVSLSAETAAGLRALGRREGATPFMVVLAGFAALLARYAGVEDVVVGTPVSGRGRRELEALVGCFVNTLVLRTDLSGDPTFAQLLDRVRETVLGAHEHGDLPFERLVQALQPERSLGHSPLFQVMFVMENEGTPPSFPGLAVRGMEAESPRARFDLILYLAQRGDGIAGSIEYRTDLFDASTIQRMADHLRRLLEQAAADAALPLSRLELMDAAERERVVGGWSASAEVAPARGGVHQRFEAMAAARPHATAVTFEGASLSYGELNARANRLARRLRALGVGTETRVGLAVERSLDLVAGILGILKAGGAYVPLDPSYPADRVSAIAQDARVRLILSPPAPHDAARWGDIPLVALEDQPGDGGDLGIPVSASQLAYVLHTSGSTGRPKGVGVTHGNVMGLLDGAAGHFGYNQDDVWSMFHAYAFDVSVFEMWGALAHGGRLIVVPWGVSRDPAAFHALLRREGVTILSQTPGAFRGLATADASLPPVDTLRAIVFAGEALDVPSVRDWTARHGDRRPAIVNMYGITETTVHTTYRVVRAADLGTGGATPVGHPLPGYTAYVLDPAGRPVPPGVPGEVFVGGAGVARGYVESPARTAERFLPDPFAGTPGARMYRSGDRVRQRADGQLEYLGRLDRQLKVRGYRIEPGEVQAALRAHPAVEDAFVADYEHAPGDRRLAAWFIPRAERAPAPRRLLEMRAAGELEGRRVEVLPDGTDVVSLNASETESLYREIFERGAYLRQGVTLPPDACVLDVGANIGLFSVRVARECPEARVFAFEPIPDVCDVLRLNARLHGGGRVRVLNHGLAEAEGEAVFTFYPNASVLSGRFADADEERETVKSYLTHGADVSAELAQGLDALLEHRLAARQVPVRLRTVSAIIREEGIERIDLLKVDVEKSELEVLNGIEAAHWPRIRQVAVEVHDTGGRLARIRALLAEQGFHVVVEQDPALAGTALYDVYGLRPGVSAQVESAAGGAGERWDSTTALAADLRRVARERLPVHMVPAAFVPVARFPLTVNGKLDRRALPAPTEAVATVPAAAFAAPRAGTEEVVARVWSAALGVERVGRDDGFFDLGGHSMLLAQVHARLQAQLEREISIVELFRFPTVAALAEHLDASGPAQPRRGRERGARRLELARGAGGRGRGGAGT